VSKSTERTRAPRPMFTGTLHLPSRSAPKPAPPALPVKAPAAAAGDDRIARRVADLALCRCRFPALFDVDCPRPLAIGIHKSLGAVLVRHGHAAGLEEQRLIDLTGLPLGGGL
jgi:hypothetical protein